MADLPFGLVVDRWLCGLFPDLGKKAERRVAGDVP